MATKISGKDIVISVNTGTEEAPVWAAFACSTSDGFSGSTESVDTATKCDGDWNASLPTTLSWEFSNSSYADADSTSSYDEAFTLWSTKAVKQFKIANEDESYYRMGTGYISSLGEAAEVADYLTFELTITGTGEVTNVPPVQV